MSGDGGWRTPEVPPEHPRDPEDDGQRGKGCTAPSMRSPRLCLLLWRGVCPWSPPGTFGLLDSGLGKPASVCSSETLLLAHVSLF